MLKTLTPEQIKRNLEINIKIAESDLLYHREHLKSYLEREGGRNV
jgi:hypothetical protein